MNRQLTVQKKWGWEKWIENNERYCLKMMGIYKDAYCSIHRHPLKDETFYVFCGALRLWVDGNFHTLTEGDSFRILPGQWHSFFSSNLMTGFYEVSTGHSDEDVERLSESAIGKTEKAWKCMIKICALGLCIVECIDTLGNLPMEKDDAQDVEKDGEPNRAVQDDAQG